MRKFILSFLVLFSYFYGFAIEPPILQCIEQLINPREIRITWSWNDMNNVSVNDEYSFVINNTTITPSLLPHPDGSMYRSSTTITLPVNLVSNHYTCHIIAQNSVTSEQCTSNTLSTIELTVTPFDLQGDSTAAFLSWDAVSSSTSGGSWDTVYHIYKKRGFEPTFDPIPLASIPTHSTQLSYIDPSDVCHNYISYQIGITNHINTAGGNSCIFKSNIQTVLLNDSILPSAPILDSVSVTEDNHIVLGFHAPDPFMMCYPIYYLDSNIRLPLFTVYNTTYWSDMNINPNDVSREYFIAVLDSCMNSSHQTDSGQCNIRLTIAHLDACHKTASFQWNGYKNMHGGLGQYRIFLSEDNGTTYQQVATTTGTSYTLPNLQLNTDYRIFIQACNTTNTITSSSNRVNFNIQSEETNDMTYIRHVSVMNNEYISVLVHTSGDQYPFNSLTLQRSEDGQNFENIQTVPYHSAADYEFQDSSAKFNKSVYYYRTYIISDCNMPVGYSNISHNILLTGSASSSHDSNLEWEAYGTWNGDVDHYIVSRRTEYDSVFQDIMSALVPRTHNQYLDDVSMLFHLGSKFTYYVTAKETMNEYGFEDESMSNQITLQQESSMIIPNAFSPNYDGHNDVFLPSNAFVSNENYELIIVSRWGKTVFRTNDPTSGWDGYDMNGEMAPTGVYTYIINYVDARGKGKQQRGCVTLLR